MHCTCTTQIDTNYVLFWYLNTRFDKKNSTTTTKRQNIKIDKTTKICDLRHSYLDKKKLRKIPLNNFDPPKNLLIDG